MLDQVYSTAEAVKSLGVGETALRRWVEQLEQERGGVTPKSKALTPEQQRIQELEARAVQATCSTHSPMNTIRVKVQGSQPLPEHLAHQFPNSGLYSQFSCAQVITE